MDHCTSDYVMLSMDGKGVLKMVRMMSLKKDGD